MTSVFISSTYTDLIEHRRAVCRILKQAGLETLEMESMGARPGEPKQVCYQEIDAADFVVGIYAYRYGFTPEGERVSITELEYKYAKERMKDILCYVVEEDYPLDSDTSSAGEDKIKLLDFKDRIQKAHTVETFTTPDSLASKVMADISRQIHQTRQGQRVILPEAVMKEALGWMGVDPYALYAQGRQTAGKIDKGEAVKARELRSWLLRRGTEKLINPLEVSVEGILQPYALMHSGWWEQEDASCVTPVRGLREWLFHGLQEWAPSWGYAWQMDESETPDKRPFHLGQIADEMSDEAESIPVYIPASKAARLTEEFLKHPGGLKVELTGVVAHRKHFCLDPSKRAAGTAGCSDCPRRPECLVDNRFGGALDFCVKVDPEIRSHRIIIRGPAGFYSGYLWKCLVPKNTVADPALAKLSDAFFIWEHTNLADRESREYNLDSLENKRWYLERKHGSMHLLQKSSFLVPGIPAISSDAFYRQLLRGNDVVI